MAGFISTTSAGSRFLLLVSLIGNVCALPTCSDPSNGADTTCPFTSQCWDNNTTYAVVTWSLHAECEECTFAQQKSVIVQSTETITFQTDGTFQRNNTLNIYKVRDLTALQNCDISGSKMVGRLAPSPATRTRGSEHSYFLDVTSLSMHGPNYFVSVHSGDMFDGAIPSNCEQGARLIVYEGDFHCGDAISPCSGVGPCVFDYDSSDFECQCPPGYTGSACEYIDECFQNTACGNADTQGVCVDGNCDFSCSCIGGHSSSQADGKSCDVVPTSCATNPCQNGGACNDGAAFGLSCECLVGFDDGPLCANIDECTSSPCQNGGTCVDGPSRYLCSCARGFTGTDCSVNINDCSPSPCVNPGSCTDGVADAICSCSSPWTGKFCQINDNDCLTSTCLNGATCIDGDYSHSCSCTAGFTGAACETDINECEVDSCVNGGICIDQPNGLTCNCPVGYTGVSCETNMDTCSSIPCQNGGTCESRTNVYHCQCPLGFTGDVCETNANECASNPCMNGGLCVDYAGFYSCDCPSNFTGIVCERLNCQCLNNGTCVIKMGMYSCECDNGFTGIRCETYIDDKCSFKPCQNGGTCIGMSDSNLCENEGLCLGYECMCQGRYKGQNCEEVSVQLEVESNSGFSAGAIAATVCGVLAGICVLVALAALAIGACRRRRTDNNDDA